MKRLSFFSHMFVHGILCDTLKQKHSYIVKSLSIENVYFIHNFVYVEQPIC